MIPPAPVVVNNFPPQPVVPVVPAPPTAGGLPEGLREIEKYHQFVVRRVDKAPCSHVTGQPIDRRDPRNWTNYSTAAAAAASFGPGYGVGFALTDGDPIGCLDIDDCRNPTTGEITVMAQALIAMLPGAYVEVSVSGTGLHVWFSYSVMPPHGQKVSGVGELYHNWYIALGTPYEAPGFTNGNVAADLTDGCAALIALFFPPKVNSGDGDDDDWTSTPREGGTAPESDAAVIELALRPTAKSEFGTKATFKDLWEANETKLAQSYPDAGGRTYDESAVDLAVAGELAYFTRCNCEQINRIMRSNEALARPKWDTFRGALTWLQVTILKAVRGKGRLYGDARAQGAAAIAPESSYLPAGTIADMTAIVAANPNKDETMQLLLQLGTQDSIASAFATLYAGKLKYDHSREKWRMWDGTRWREDDKKRVFDLAVSLCREKNREGKSSIGSANFASGVLAIASSRPSLATSGSEWDLDNYLLNTPAGTIDLRTGKMREHDPEDFITKCTAASPDAAGDGAVFRKFMLEITDGDEELVRYHQVSIGACLSGAIEEHWVQFWVGEGRNGKNSYGDLVEELMGDYARTIRTSTLMSKSHQSHPEELANLQGIRMAISSEVNDGDHWDESRIKQVTGDAKISARFMYGSSFTFPRTHKHLIYGNHRPQLRSTDAAIRSRIKIVPFKVSFRGREDADLPRRLRAEMGYVLQWLIEGHRKWMEAGKKLPRCAAVEAESAEYFASQSTPEMWLEECTEAADPLSQLLVQCPTSGDLYRSYGDWKKDRGEQPLSQTRWAETMQKKFQKVKSATGFRYKGLRMLPRQYGGPPFPMAPLPPGATLSN